MKKVFITGGTGFLGRNLVDRLSNHYKLTVLTRKLPHTNEYSNVEYILGDLLSENLENLIKGHDVVIHLAGLVNYSIQTFPEMYSLNVEGTVRLCEICKKENIKKFVFASTYNTEAYFSGEKKVDLGHIGYIKTKKMAEQAISQLLNDSKTHFDIIRPSSIYGPGFFDHYSRKSMKDLVFKKSIWLCPPGGINIVSLEAVLESFETSLKNLECTYIKNVTGINMTYKKLLYEFRERINRSVLIVAVPRWPLKCFVRIARTIKLDKILKSFELDLIEITLYNNFSSEKLTTKHSLKEIIDEAFSE